MKTLPFPASHSSFPLSRTIALHCTALFASMIVSICCLCAHSIHTRQIGRTTTYHHKFLFHDVSSLFCNADTSIEVAVAGFQGCHTLKVHQQSSLGKWSAVTNHNSCHVIFFQSQKAASDRDVASLNGHNRFRQPILHNRISNNY